MKNFVVLIIFFLFGCTTNNQDSKDKAETTSTESPPVITLADFKFSDLQGNTFSAEEYKGKPVFMHFWATWCRPCIQEMPAIGRVIEKTDNIHFIFPSDEQVNKIRKFKNSQAFSFNYLQLTSGFEQVGVSALPTTYLFNSKGELHETIVGARNWDTEESIAILKKLKNSKQ